MGLGYTLKLAYRKVVPQGLRKFINRCRFVWSDIRVKYFSKIDGSLSDEKVLAVLTPNIKFPVFIRSKTTDAFAYCEIFKGKPVYAARLGYSPKLIIDCGANIGLATIFFKSKYPESSIVSIEPERANFLLLEKNLEHYDKVFLVNKGVWSKKTRLYITNPSGDSIEFHTEEITPELESRPDFDNESAIETIGIDDAWQSAGGKECSPYIDLLKVDVEGAEADIFSKNYETWLPQTRTIIIELHGAHCSEIVRTALSKYHFKEQCISGSGVAIFTNETLMTE